MTQPNTIGTGTCPLERRDLFEIFQRVLEDWAFLPSEDIGEPVPGPAPLSLECQVGFSGPLQGTLVVRAPEAFGQHLWENVSGEVPGDEVPSGRDAFREFVNLYFGHILTALRREVDGVFDPFLPAACDPSSWPKREPCAALALLVEESPVEIRLWMDPPLAKKEGAAHAS